MCSASLSLNIIFYFCLGLLEKRWYAIIGGCLGGAAVLVGLAVLVYKTIYKSSPANHNDSGDKVPTKRVSKISVAMDNKTNIISKT